MTTAVLISGQMRTADVCIESIRPHVYARLPGVTIGLPGKQAIRWLRYKTFAATAADEDAWKIERFPCVLGMTEPQPWMDEKNYNEHVGLGCYGVQVVLRQLWALRRAWQIMEADGFRPDWVVRLRPDCFFHSPMERFGECDPRCVYVPTFHNFFGLNDRFAFGGYDAMKIYCNRLDSMDEYIAAGGVFHPESHLKWAMDMAGIQVRRTAVTFDLVRKTGQRIAPQWNHDCDYGDIPP